MYHSIYDTPAWYQQFSDGDRIFGKALTQVMTHRDPAPGRRAGTAFRFQFALGQRDPMGGGDSQRAAARKRQGQVDLRPVSVQLMRLSAAAKAYDEELSAWSKRGGHQRPRRLAKVDESMRKTERALLSTDGLPGRDWYRSQIYAPGMLTGYAAKTLPGVREAVEAQQWDEANRQARKLAESLRAAAVQVEESTRLLKQVQYMAHALSPTFVSRD